MPQPHIFHLSSVDQSQDRAYIRLCLCFAAETDSATAVSAIVQKLNTAVRRAITNMPILAGTVIPIELSADIQQGRLCVQVTLHQINSFRATYNDCIQASEAHIYQKLSSTGMSSAAINNEEATPLPDRPDQTSSPAFAVQATVIKGGVLVALYLHHSVADIQGMAPIMRLMAGDLPSREQLTDEDIQIDVINHKILHCELNSPYGTKANRTAHSLYTNLSLSQSMVPYSSQSEIRSYILAFDLESIFNISDMVNERFNKEMRDETCLAAILWTAINRARFAQADIVEQDPRIVIPINIRNATLHPVGNEYFGNGTANLVVSKRAVELTLGYEIPYLANTAGRIHKAINQIDSKFVRSAVAAINGTADVRTTNSLSIDYKHDLVVCNWAGLPVDEAGDVGLGLGSPDWVREISRGVQSPGCIILPQDGERKVWEVMVRVTEEEMGRMEEDEVFAGLVSGKN